jgi:succinyl-CoA:acetate CoA-transferase
VIIENCAHPDYRPQLRDYFARACERGGQTPHILEEAISWYALKEKSGTMLKS